MIRTLITISVVGFVLSIACLAGALARAWPTAAGPPPAATLAAIDIVYLLALDRFFLAYPGPDGVGRIAALDSHAAASTASAAGLPRAERRVIIKGCACACTTAAASCSPWLVFSAAVRLA